MYDILLADSNTDALEKNVWWVKTNCSWKTQRGDSIDYLGYKLGLPKIQL